MRQSLPEHLFEDPQFKAECVRTCKSGVSRKYWFDDGTLAILEAYGWGHVGICKISFITTSDRSLTVFL